MTAMQRHFRKRGGLPWWFWRQLSEREDRKPPFTPLSLFGAGEVGGWWDPSDTSTLFQNTAATIPVTADSQPVGRINDKSGRGNHLLQIGLDTTRLTYKTSGGQHWVEGDGVADYLRASFTIVQPWERVSAIRQITWTSNDFIFGGGAAANAGTCYQISGTPFIRIYSGSGNVGPTNSPAVGTNAVLTERHAGASSRITVNSDAYVVGNAGATACGGITLFASQSATAFGNVRCYGVVMRAGTMLGHEMAALREWLAAKAGVTL